MQRKDHAGSRHAARITFVPRKEHTVRRSTSLQAKAHAAAARAARGPPGDPLWRHWFQQRSIGLGCGPIIQRLQY